METNRNGREDRPNQTDPEEAGFTHPSKAIQSQHKIDINQSALGREQGQTPADEHIENTFSQIDDQTGQIQVVGSQNPEEHHESLRAGYMNDETSADRDTGNSHDDGWEESRRDTNNALGSAVERLKDCKIFRFRFA